MSGRWLLILFCILSCTAARASESPTIPSQIRLASEEWIDYTGPYPFEETSPPMGQ